MLRARNRAKQGRVFAVSKKLWPIESFLENEKTIDDHESVTALISSHLTKKWHCDEFHQDHKINFLARMSSDGGNWWYNNMTREDYQIAFDSISNKSKNIIMALVFRASWLGVRVAGTASHHALPK